MNLSGPNYFQNIHIPYIECRKKNTCTSPCVENGTAHTYGATAWGFNINSFEKKTVQSILDRMEESI